MRYRLEVRLTAADVGQRVVLRWRRPARGGGEEVADVLGILQAADRARFTVRKASGEVVVIPVERALAGKTVPPAPRARPRTRKALWRGHASVPHGSPGEGRGCLPLRYQFEAEHPGEFGWDYLEAGPGAWRVRIGRAAA